MVCDVVQHAPQTRLCICNVDVQLQENGRKLSAEIAILHLQHHEGPGHVHTRHVNLGRGRWHGRYML